MRVIWGEVEGREKAARTRRVFRLGLGTLNSLRGWIRPTRSMPQLSFNIIPRHLSLERDNRNYSILYIY